MTSTIIAKIRQWAQQLKQDVVAVYFAARNPERNT